MSKSEKRIRKKALKNELRDEKFEEVEESNTSADKYHNARNKGRVKKASNRKVKRGELADSGGMHNKRVDTKLVEISEFDNRVVMATYGDGEELICSVVDDERLLEVRTRLRMHSINLLLDSRLDTGAKREEMREVIRGYRDIVKSEAEVEFILNDIIGLGVFQLTLDIPHVTDIDYASGKIYVKTNQHKVDWLYDVSPEYVEAIVGRIATKTGKDFTHLKPVIDAEIDRVRINAVHKKVSPDGVTFAMRMSHTRLVLNESNFEVSAPLIVGDLLKSLIHIRSNMVLIGITGSGKTELQKYILGSIPKDDKVIVVEDTAELRLKKLYPNMHVASWLTSENEEIKDLIRPALRQNPKWIIVSETRGAEIYQLMQVMQSGHSVVTSLHTGSLRSVPDRVVGMVSEGYGVDEDRAEKNVLETFHIGVHMYEHEYEGQTYRYIREIAEYSPAGITTLVEQRMIGHELHLTRVGKLSEGVVEKLEEFDVDFHWNDELPEISKEYGKPGTYTTPTRFTDSIFNGEGVSEPSFIEDAVLMVKDVDEPTKVGYNSGGVV